MVNKQWISTNGIHNPINVSYNSFNLPSEIDFGNNQKLSYYYDGSGRKLTKINTPAGYYPTNTEYRGQMVHQSTNGVSSLKYIITPEGRLKNTGTNAAPVWAWEYDLKDHLGNTRVTFKPNTTNNGVVRVEYANYFPFGMKMLSPYSSASSNKYLYNGKEMQDDFGLNWYDYGARMYDPAIGRWHSVDPLCEDGGQESITPYGYVFNDPIKHNDPDGRFPLLSNLAGAAAGAIVEYGGQVAANVYENGWSTSAFTDNIDVGDIGFAAGEGFMTSGGSVVKNALVKTTLVVGSEVAKNYLDYKTSSDGIGLKFSTNDAGTTVKNTAIGLSIGKIGDVAPAPKVKVMKAPTPKQAVSKARADAKTNGNTVNRQQRIATENKAKQGQKTAASVNKTTAKTFQNTVASGASETIKQQTDEKR